MKYPFLQWSLWIFGALVQLLVLTELLRSRLHRSFRFFALFLGWQALRVVPSMIAFRYSLSLYYRLFWFFEVADWGLIFLIILELYEYAFDHYAGIRNLFRLSIVWWTGATTLAIAVSIAFAGMVEAQPYQWVANWLFLMERSIRLAHSALLLFLVAFLACFGVRTAYLLRYLVVGWLVDSVLQSARGALRYQLGPQVLPYLNLVTPISYIAVLLLWFWAIRTNPAHAEEPPAPFAFRGHPEMVLAGLEGINAALLRTFRR